MNKQKRAALVIRIRKLAAWFGQQGDQEMAADFGAMAEELAHGDRGTTDASKGGDSVSDTLTRKNSPTR